MGIMETRDSLQNVRIIDFTWVLAGPYATRILADFGAEVIKIQSRSMMGEEDMNLTWYFNAWNRNKLSITLNLNKPEGIEIAKKLISVSDVVVENFSPRVMHNWGLDYDTLSHIKPDLIMLSMSGMGQTGPWKDRVAFGPTIQAASGMTNLTTFPGHPPIGLGYSYADHIAGLMGALSILEVLEYRHKTGTGQYIDLSELEANSVLMGVPLLDYFANGTVALPTGNHATYVDAAPHNVYRCHGDDRWCAICIFTEEEWRSFCRVIGNPPWTRKKKFSNISKRMENVEELDSLVEEWTIQHTAEEVMTSLQEAGISSGVVQDARDLSQDPQLRDRCFYVETDHPVLGKTLSDGTPIKLSASPAQFRRASPLLGQDNDYVYRQLIGMSETDIMRYTDDGIIG